MTGEEKRREEEYPYTDIRIRRGNRVTFYVSKNEKRDIYIPDYYLPTLKKLREILKREGKTLSEWIRDHAIEYVRLHEPGNPQQRIDTIMKLGKAYRAVPFCKCGKKASRKVTTTRNAIIYCCGLHMPHDALRWKEMNVKAP